MELKRVYALYGPSNSGKTSTLNQFVEHLKIKAEKELYSKKLSNGDQLIVMLVNGVYIGISTQGDSKAQVERNLDLIEPKCNIIFCATRTRGGTCHHVIERFGQKLTWLQQMTIFNQSKGAFDNETFVRSRDASLGQLLQALVD